ncbi:hypothetical protein INR49_018976 [Caranx melampygus]|nr:hypothetical protein INR49_018976 [Caranx melampygus]
MEEEGGEVVQHLSQFTSALLPADDTPQRPSPVQPLQMSLMSLKVQREHTEERLRFDADGNRHLALWRGQQQDWSQGQKKIIYMEAILLLGALTVAAYFYKDSFQYNNTFLREDVGQAVSPLVKESFKCQQNLTAANLPGFNDYPHSIKDMLLYGHCRNYPLILDVPNKCRWTEGPTDIFLLLVIKSSPSNYERREVLRKTWAEERTYNGVWIRRVFIIGTAEGTFEKDRWNSLVKAEQRKNNDILQWDFTDTFFNLTLKQSLFLDWLGKNCHQVRFLFDGDDDVFVNSDNLVDYLQSLDNDGSKHLFSGFVMGGGPIRDPWTKYYVPKVMYEPDSYALYCSGAGYFMSMYTAMVIHRMSKSIPLITIDDAYIGLCLQKAKLKPSHHIGVISMRGRGEGLGP